MSKIKRILVEDLDIAGTVDYEPEVQIDETDYQVNKLVNIINDLKADNLVSYTKELEYCQIMLDRLVENSRKPF